MTDRQARAARPFRLTTVLAWLLVVLYFAAGFGYLGLRHWLWPNLDRWRDTIAGQLSGQLGRPVGIDRLSTGFDGWRPRLRVDGLTISDDQGQVQLRIASVQAVAGLRSLLMVRPPRFSSLVIEQPSFSVERLGAGQWRVAGFDVDAHAPPASGGPLDWLLAQRSIRIVDADVRLEDQVTGEQAELSRVELRLSNRGARHLADLRVGQAGALADQGRLLAVLERRVDLAGVTRGEGWRAWRGQLWAQVLGLKGGAVSRMLPDGSIDPGMGDMQGWASFAGQQPLDLVFDTRLTNPGWRSVSDDPPAGSAGLDESRLRDFRLDGLRGRIELRLGRDGRVQHLALPELALSTSDGLVLRGRGPQQLDFASDGSVAAARLSLDPFELKEGLILAQSLPLPEAVARPLRGLRGSGRITQLDVAMSRPATDGSSGPGSPRLSGEIAFSRLSLLSPASVMAQGAPPERPAAAGPRKEAAPRSVGPRQTGSRETGSRQTGSRQAAPRPAVPAQAASRPAAVLRLAAPNSAGRRPGPSALPPHHGPPLGVPAIENVSGSARFDGDRGDIRFAAEPDGAALIFPNLFEDPRVPLSELQVEAAWEMRPRLTVRVDRFQAANDDAALTVRGQYQAGGKGHGMVDFQGQIPRARADRVARYLPLELRDSVRHWVAGALKAGTGGEGSLRLRGDLEDFPFVDPKEGEFRIAARVRNGTLQFEPDWPPLEGIDAQLSFERASMSIVAARSRTYGVDLSAVRATIADLQHPELVIEGTAQGLAQRMIAYANETPVNRHLDGGLRGVSASGAATLGLKLSLPLAELDNAEVAGAVDLTGNDVRLQPALPLLADLRGRVQFSHQGVALQNLRGSFLGGPIRIDGTPDPSGQMRVEASGSISGTGLRTVSDDALTRSLQGQTDYRASFLFGVGSPTIRIESDLAGMAINLPPPLRKPAEQRWPLLIAAQPPSRGAPSGSPPSGSPPSGSPPGSSPGTPVRDVAESITVSLRDQPLMEIERLFDASGRASIQRVALGIGAAPVLPDRGMGVLVHADRLDLDEWSGLLKDTPLAAGPSHPLIDGFSPVPARIGVLAKQVMVAGRELHDVVLGVTYDGKVWRNNLSSREVDGSFDWLQPTAGRGGLLRARFARLEIPSARAGELDSMFDPGRASNENLPAIDLIADHLVLGNTALGRLKVMARSDGTAQQPEWRLEQLELDQPSARLNASGTWAPRRRDADQRRTRLNYNLEIHDAGVLLTTFGVKDAVRGGAGTLKGTIAWNASPLAIDYPSLRGTVAIGIGRGQFLKTDPGLAKLIGVLNLQSLPRRLSLDFRDVFAEGFAFDRIDGNVRIDRGVAHTDDLTMNGVQANVRIKGEADIARETQSLDVEVRPEFNAGLASLAYAAISPVIGLGTFLAQAALSKPLAELFAYEYSINGSWVDPKVSEKRRIEPAPSAPATTP